GACGRTAAGGGGVEDIVAAGREGVGGGEADGPGLVGLPELFDVGYVAFDAYARAAGSVAGDRLSRFAAGADEEDINVLAGTVVEDLAASAADGIEAPADEGLANTAVLFDRSGERRLVYRKRHRFGYGSEETDRMVAGERVPMTDIEGVQVGVTTCYDLRFP
ncbi:nitrilase-related carbon-nitrogen hydrolase, partial [Halorubrum lacusprofundi]|uniref:nitrilase-related carbon-nitrogen hydrolase n=1 Tax=Halorubrum lacusprofundi TaxID=2247 RepID=UPI0037448288